MLKEAMQFLLEKAGVRLEKVGDQVFSTQKLYEVPQATPNTIEVHSLSGLVEYLHSEFDSDDKLMVHVSSPTKVVCFSQLNRDANRNHMVQARAMLPEFAFERWYDAENFNIKLQSCFVESPDRDIMLKVVGNIKEESVNTIGDDGVSQAVVAKTGVATVANVKVPNPVILKPFRTFVEVEQPASDFIFRMQSGPKCALFEADGGAWKLEAMNRIKAYLADALKREIAQRRIVIIA